MKQVLTFRAIPYARSTRFSAPSPVGFDDAMIRRDRGPVCPQSASRLEPINGPQFPLSQDEHCQVLSVSTSSTVGRRPVVVWLHGGAYLTGGGELPWYDGDRLVSEHDLVFVSVTYRLGALGYLRLPGAQGPSNGLADQVEALRWVQANIERFGGDPDSVVVAGQSAGAHSISALLAWGHGYQLFRRAIAHSCPAVPLLTPEKGEEICQAFLKALGLDPFEASAAQILEAQAAVLAFADLPFSPAAPPKNLHGGPVDILSTWTAQDAGFFILGDRPAAWLNTPTGRSATDGATQKMFEAGSVALAQMARESGGSAEVIRIDWNSDQLPWRSCHCIELPLLLGSEKAWESASMLGPGLPDERERAGLAMRRMWANVARGAPKEGWLDDEIVSAARLQVMA